MAAGEHPLVAAYLRRLDDAARALPGGQRSELVTDIREHLADALPPDAGEADIRAVLDRLGDPEAIVAAAVESGSAGGSDRRVVSVTPGRQASAWLELSAALLMTLGSVLVPIIGWLVGAAVMWTSRRWRLREKVIGTLLVPGGIGGIGAIALMGGSVTGCSSTTSAAAGSGPPVTESSCSNSTTWVDHVELAGIVTAAVLSLVVPFVLFVIARRRADRETHVVFAPAPA